MKIRSLLSTVLFAVSAVALVPAAAASAEALVGLPPSKLLKSDQTFTSTYRAIIKGQDLPEWTERLSVGFPTEAVEIAGQRLFLTSACNPDTGCDDERFYLLYDPAARSMIGFFFLSPALDTSGDHRMAFSRWLGKLPKQEHSAFLMERAMRDSQNPERDPARLPRAEPEK
ncbi:MAG: Ivy family c-type lysozyme inhibitor [Azospira sp.]|jgi:hypothetical protein|nr:Ivy family c-type lysozyme inhibitor [Azospira sp.]